MKMWVANYCPDIWKAKVNNFFVLNCLVNVFNVLKSIPGLQKLFHSAIPDGRTWSKFGKHGNMENICSLYAQDMHKIGTRCAQSRLGKP